jgi:hypothetical protein
VIFAGLFDQTIHLRSSSMVDLYEAWNKPEEAEEWRSPLPQAEAVER